jgi:mercuric ion transport protein
MNRVLQRVLPSGLGGLAGLACALCCVVPVLIGAGVLGGAGWVAFGRVVPGIAVALVGVAGLSWWALRRRHVCAGPGCDCS